MNAPTDEVTADGSRRTFLMAGVVGTAAIAPYASTPASAASPGPDSGRGTVPQRPNILLLHAHDLGRFLNCYGVETARTPNLNQLAAEGVIFERCFATAPQCSPSRASIFTGRYPHNNGVMGLTHHPFNWDLNPDERHLGQLLKEAGYRTGGAGILHETHLGPARCGLDEYFPRARATDVADATIDMLTRYAGEPGQPFYIQSGTMEIHRLGGVDPNADLGFLGQDIQPDTAAGVTVPGYLQPTDGTKAELGELQGSVHHLDEEFGRILAALKQLGLDRNTLAIFTTDHGIALPRAKGSVYEPGQETAFILRLPSRPGWSGGSRQHALISNIDYLPTILEVADVPIPSRVQGRSFAPLLDGREYKPREFVFYELTYHGYYDPQRAVRTENHKLIVYFSTAPSFMDPSQSWRPRCDTIVPPNQALSYHTSIELYDLKADPWEQHNVAKEPAYQDELEHLRGLLIAHMEETRDPILKGAVSSPMHHEEMAWLKGG